MESDAEKKFGAISRDFEGGIDVIKLILKDIFTKARRLFSKKN